MQWLMPAGLSYSSDQCIDTPSSRAMTHPTMQRKGLQQDDVKLSSTTYSSLIQKMCLTVRRNEDDFTEEELPSPARLELLPEHMDDRIASLILFCHLLYSFEIRLEEGCVLSLEAQ